VTEFDDIYKTYFNDVYLYIRKLSNDENIAEEITSESFFKAMRSIDRFRGDCDIRVWLCQIAKNSYFSYLKKNKRFADISSLDELDLPDYSDGVEENVINQSDAMQIHIILHKLPEPYKEIFMLRVFSELSFEQIGKIFNKSQNWACVTYHRARAKIKEQMEDKHDEK
jgi:RNA polymerase sigma-70 factor (ECF subfamily)